MELNNLTDFLTNEKNKLLQATEFLVSFYKQLFSSIVTIRESLFKHAFSSDPEWKKLMDPSTHSLNTREFQLLSTEGTIQNNSDYIINVLNNIRIIVNTFLIRLDQFTLEDIVTIRKSNNYTWEFIKRLYCDENLGLLTGQRLEVALSIKATIKERLENNIAPFFNHLEMIIEDRYRVALIPALKRLVGHYKIYMEKPLNYDKSIKAICAEINIEYNQELILRIITDLSKEKSVLINEIKARYKTEETEGPKKNTYRLKEIASRFVAQLGNLAKLENFINAVFDIFQPVSSFTRFLNFLRKLFTGKGSKPTNKDFSFYYTARTGKLEHKYSSIKSILKDINLLKNIIHKFKSTMEFFTLTKNSGSSSSKEVENIIDNCITELTGIYDKCNGLREWIIDKKNQKNLSRLPSAKQEEFNNVLLSINYTLIINKQHVRDLEMNKHKSV